MFRKILWVFVALFLFSCSRQTSGPQQVETPAATPTATLALIELPDTGGGAGQGEALIETPLPVFTPALTDDVAEMETDTPATPAGAVDHLHAGDHLRLAERPQPSPEDRERAEQFIEAARQALGKYADYQVALDEGYRILAPGVPQEVYHFIQWSTAYQNMESVDPARPTALLYAREPGGYRWVGAMYSAPYETGESELDARYPLSMVQWHAHINICVPPGRLDMDRLVDDLRFGFSGSIATSEDCARASGTFLSNMLGWMVHITLEEP